jgi:hypothetical protein
LSWKIKEINTYICKKSLMITINEQQLKDLEAFINQIPTAYGLPLLQFLGKLNAEQNPPVEEVNAD